MKHFFRYLQPKTPCNVIDPLIGASLIGLGAGAVSSFIGSISADKTNKENYKYQRALMQEQHTLGLQNLRQQHHYNIDSLNAAYAMENQYNSPLVQKSKMLAAGLNPYYNEAGAVSAQSNPNPTSVGLPSTTLPSYQYQSPWAAFANLPAEFANVANATKAIAEAKKVGVDTTIQERAMEDYLNDIHEKWRGSKLANDYQEVITNWYQDSGRHYLDEQDRKVTMEIGNLLAQGNLADAERFLTDEKQKQLHNENSLWSNIKDYIVRQKAAEAEDAEARVETTKAQGEMYKNQGIAALRASDAAISQALTAAANGKAYRIQLRSAAKLNDAQISKMASELVGAYVDQNGLHVDDSERSAAQQLLKRQIVAQTKSMDAKAKQDRFNTYNPFTYLGQIFGGAGAAILTKIAK